MKNGKRVNSSRKFEGFEMACQSWDFPTVLDRWVDVLSGSEFKCLWYILRHTYGWQKTSDAISITQFEKGIFSKSKNLRVDRGTGLSRETITIALKKLEEKGFIKKISQGKKGGVRGVNRYEVVIKTSSEDSSPADEEGRSENLTEGSQEIRPGVVGKSDTQSLTSTIPKLTKKDFDVSLLLKAKRPAGKDINLKAPEGARAYARVTRVLRRGATCAGEGAGAGVAYGRAGVAYVGAGSGTGAGANVAYESVDATYGGAVASASRADRAYECQVRKQQPADLERVEHTKKEDVIAASPPGAKKPQRFDEAYVRRKMRDTTPTGYEERQRFGAVSVPGSDDKKRTRSYQPLSFGSCSHDIKAIVSKALKNFPDGLFA